MAAERKTEIDIDEIITIPEDEPEAEDALEAEEPSLHEETPAPKKKRKKIRLTPYRVIFLTFGCLFFFIVEVAVMFYFFGPKGTDKEIVKEMSKKVEIPFNSFYIGTFYLPLKDTGIKEELFFKISIEAEYSGELVKKELESIKIHLRNSIYTMLKVKKLKDVNGKKQRDQLNSDILLQINDFLDEGQVEKVLFTEYVII